MTEPTQCSTPDMLSQTRTYPYKIKAVPCLGALKCAAAQHSARPAVQLAQSHLCPKP